jgi:hypothetical protein
MSNIDVNLTLEEATFLYRSLFELEGTYGYEENRELILNISEKIYNTMYGNKDETVRS